MRGSEQWREVCSLEGELRLVKAEGEEEGIISTFVIQNFELGFSACFKIGQQLPLPLNSESGQALPSAPPRATHLAPPPKP